MKKHRSFLHRRFVFLLAASVLLVTYQNCGQGFKSRTMESISSTSANCFNFMRSAAAKFISPDVDLKCDDFSQYSCMQRVYRPGISAGRSQSEFCVASNRCIPVEVFNFDTSVIKAESEDVARELAPGGDYNRTDTSCSHSYLVDGVRIILGEGGDLSLALKDAQNRCAIAQGRGDK